MISVYIFFCVLIIGEQEFNELECLHHGPNNLGGVSIAWRNKGGFIKKGIGSPSISLQEDVDNTTRVLPKDSTYTGDPSLTLISASPTLTYILAEP